MEAEAKRWWQFDVGTVTGVLALIFSMYSVVVANRQHADTEGTTLINEMYSTYLDISTKRMDSPAINHIVCEPQQYSRVVALVREATSGLGPDARAQERLRESAMAMYVFAQFEQALYLHQNAIEAGDTARVRFTQATLDYFSKTLLPNPRLVHFWSKEGENMRIYHDAIAQTYWDRYVRPVGRPDHVGPFAP